MYKKFNDLAFVIGLFFSIISVVLLLAYLLATQPDKLNLYTGIVFLLFGLGMIFFGGAKNNVEM